jgi:hypothetical protein
MIFFSWSRISSPKVITLQYVRINQLILQGFRLKCVIINFKS